MKRSFDRMSVVFARFSVAFTQKSIGPLARKSVPRGRRKSPLFSGLLPGLALLVATMGQARGDLVQVVNPANYDLEQYSYANGQYLGIYNYTGVAPASINYFNSYSSANFSSATNATIGYNTASTPTSFTANVGFYGAAQQFSGIDPNSSLSTANTVTEASLSGLALTLSQPSVATVTWNATNLLGSLNFNLSSSGSYGAAGVGSFLEIDGANGSYAEVGSGLSQDNSTLTSYLTAQSSTGSPSYIDTSYSGNSISLDLAPGTYYIEGYSQTYDAFYYANGYMNYPQTGDSGSVTINALSTPEPASLVLFAFGAVGVIGVSRRRQKKWRGPLAWKRVPRGRGRGWLFSASLAGLVLLVGTMGEARGDLVQVVNPADYELQQYSYANGQYLGNYDYTGVAPASINNFNSFSSANFSAATNATIGYNTTSTPTSFTANVGFYAAAAQFSGIDPSSPLSNTLTLSQAIVSGLELNISQPSVATVTWNATNLLGSLGFNLPNNLSAADAGIDSYLAIYGTNGSSAEVSSALYQYDSTPTSSLTAQSDTGSPSYITTSYSGTSISLDLTPGVYYIQGESQTYDEFYYANGYMNYPQTGDSGSVTINALSTPEPASLVLFAFGAVGVIGVSRRGQRRRAT
jgi:hypothetical protein